MAIDRRENADWDALRDAYLAGGVGMKALAEEHGVSLYALRRRAKDEGWTALRRENGGIGKGPAVEPEEAFAGEPDGQPAEGSDGEADGEPEEDSGEEPDVEPIEEDDEEPGRVAARLYLKLLRRLERVADAIPDGAVTEFKTQDSEAARLFKLRDLTAAYKDIAGDLPGDGEDQDGQRVIIDV